jgi:hypothetical protein
MSAARTCGAPYVRIRVCPSRRSDLGRLLANLDPAHELAFTHAPLASYFESGQLIAPDYAL